MRKQLLLCGGAVGHLMHLYDSKDLTFKEIKTILRKASTGRLEKTSEKMDGQQLTFSYDVENGQLRVARSSGDISKGGMDSAALATKFAGRGSVEDAFTGAFKVLEGAIGSLPEKAKLKVFGNSLNRWYSTEIIYTKNPNVINYDTDSLVFHGWPVFSVDKSGTVSMTEDEGGGVDILTQHIERMQKAVASTGWKVRGPSIGRMKSLSNGEIYTSTATLIDGALSAAGVGDDASMGEYLASLMTDDVIDLELDPKVERMVVARCIGEDGAPGLVEIKKYLDKSQQAKVSEFVKNSPALMKGYVRPIELAINDFAVEILKGLSSTLIDDTDKEVQRLRTETEQAIAAIEGSGNEAAMSILKTQMEKLKSVENVTSPVEGIVFIYKGNAYKFTGSFASCGQILGLFKYGRGNIKVKKD